MPRKKKDDEIEETIAAGDETAVEGTPVEAAAGDDSAPVEEAPVEAVPAVEVKPKSPPKKVKSADGTAPGTTDGKTGGKRAEKIGIVSSDKMMKTVTVRVDRLVKHPVYRKYVRKRK